MKIYRCIIGCLLVFFFAIGVWYVVSCYDKGQSISEGTLIWRVEDGADHSIC